MKFRLKITLCMLGLLSVLFGVGGSLLISISFQNTLEREQQVVLLFGQGNLRAVPAHLHGAGVNLQTAHPEHRLVLPPAAQHHVHPGQQLHNFKGLDDIVLSPGPEAPHPVVHRVFRRDEDDRHLHGADVLHQLKAVDLGEHHVQQDEVIAAPLQQIGGLRPVKGAGTGVALLGQAEAKQIGDGLLVLHNQDSYHAVPPYRRPAYIVPASKRQRF